MEKRKFCHCCGMPISKDPQGGGTDMDGTRIQKYCSYCYQNGEFLFKGSVKEFQEFCRQKMIEGGSNKFTAWLYTRGMKRLERWKNN